MIVADLIRELQKLTPTAKVRLYYYDGEDEGSRDATSVHEWDSPTDGPFVYVD